jgi:hypothetical protein
MPNKRKDGLNGIRAVDTKPFQRRFGRPEVRFDHIRNG